MMTETGFGKSLNLTGFLKKDNNVPRKLFRLN